MSLIPIDYHHSWSKFITDEIIEEIESIEKKIGMNFNPEYENVLRFLKCDLNNVKVIILGQDPYPEKGRATGRSFEVGDLHSWNDKFRQVSLKNIVRLIHKAYNNITEYNDIKKFSYIQQEIENRDFIIAPPDCIFEVWEKQGVLMLNTYFTVETGVPGSHTEYWEHFSKKLLNYISSENEDISWFLWGKQAEDKKQFIKNGKFYTSRHPMMCSEKYEDDFLKGKCFQDTIGIINWLGVDDEE